MQQRVVLIFAITMTAAVAVGISFFAVLMAPIKKGTPGEFWYATCNVVLDPNDKDVWRGQVLLQEGWFIYESVHLHGSRLYRVRESEAMEYFPEVIKKFEAECANDDPNNYFLSGYIKWKAIEESDRYGVEGLLEKIESARDDFYHTRFPTRLYDRYLDRYILRKRLMQAKWYWANILFEFILLSGIVWYAVWPIIKRKRKSPLDWAWRFGMVPLFFFLPLYLGYAAYSRTSVGVSGGVLYPFMVIFIHGGSPNNVEQAILERIPQILEPLSQDIGIPMALSGCAMPRPVLVLGFSVVMAIIAFMVSWWIKHKKR